MTPMKNISDSDKSLFHWTGFYEAIADGLLGFRNRRDELIAGIHSIASKEKSFISLTDIFADGRFAPLTDIDPFTVIGTFNRALTDANRKAIASGLADLLGVSDSAPGSFAGVPNMPIIKSWFFGHAKDRQPDDIDTLWEVFACAIALAKSDDVKTRSAFVSAYDKAKDCHGVKWNLTMGLYWIRPWKFQPLDSYSRSYISKELKIQIVEIDSKNLCNATDYLALLDTLEPRFREDACPVHSFPELSLKARLTKDNKNGKVKPPTPPNNPYSIDDILTDGCFIAREKLTKILGNLQTKQNLILQGPPGTGKTWLAKRLAFALMGQCDDSKVRSVQFHPNFSYEDFIRGWRPEGDGKLTLVDGPFMEMIGAAKKDPESKYVIVIEEVNRGNPAQIFGEMLTLLEADKRTLSAALELSYKQFDDERVFIPKNLYVIGTMNIADRSLALVDLALRRRFAFIDLEPAFGQPWRDWVQSKYGIDSALLLDIEERLTRLNKTISGDSSLGAQFRVGHSYVTPTVDRLGDAREWFRQVVDAEIGPLLDEYWFDNLEKSQEERAHLLEGF